MVKKRLWLRCPSKPPNQLQTCAVFHHLTKRRRHLHGVTARIPDQTQTTFRSTGSHLWDLKTGLVVKLLFRLCPAAIIAQRAQNSERRQPSVAFFAGAASRGHPTPAGSPPPPVRPGPGF